MRNGEPGRAATLSRRERKPAWLKVRFPEGERARHVRQAVSGHGLHTVCEEARCPNVAECWGAGTATFMILGDTCTRGCRFCAVTRGHPGARVDEAEPRKVARAARAMGLDYAVVTSVTRDDLPDGGAGRFAATTRELKNLVPPVRVELLIPDYRSDSLTTVIDAGPDVLAHNVEVVERLTPHLRHPRFDYRRSLQVLAEARSVSPRLITKSSLMLGLGETREEVLATLEDLRAAGTDILVLGQYLQPTLEHAPVAEYVRPEQFDELARLGEEMGFGFVAAGPLVRTSYRAAEAYVQRTLRQEEDR